MRLGFKHDANQNKQQRRDREFQSFGRAKRARRYFTSKYGS